MGLILSDASLQTHNKGITYKIKFELGDKNNKNADYVHSVFNEWKLSPFHKKYELILIVTLLILEGLN